MIIKDTYQEIEYSIIYPSTCKYSCLFLHGFGERADDIIRDSILKSIAEAYSCAIILPDTRDIYYSKQLEHYLIKEFIPFIQEKYHLLTNKETSFISGVSMGGFHSLLFGSTYPHLFAKIVSISGAFIINSVTNRSPNIVRNQPPSYFLKLFEAEYLESLQSLRTSYVHNPLVRALEALKHSQLSPVFLACGINDSDLYQPNLKIYASLLDPGGDVTWFEDKGSHDWTFYNLAIPHAFEWLIERPCQ